MTKTEKSEENFRRQSDIRHQTSDFGLQTPDVRLRTSDNQTSDFGRQPSLVSDAPIHIKLAQRQHMRRARGGNRFNPFIEELP